MDKIKNHLWVCLILFAPFGLQAGGDEVVVIYNTRLPESKAVAEHYAAARQVPERQVFGFGLPLTETMSRSDFTELLQKPLADRLEATRLWRFGEVAVRDDKGKVETTEFRVLESKIRYAVLCYGVPLKIEPAAKLDEFAAKIAGKSGGHNEAAVDSELAWLPRIKNPVSLTGPLLNATYGCTNRDQLTCTNGILLVARLDGPTPDIANHLVDKAIEAESNGFWGRAYFDARGLPDGDRYALGDKWLLAGAEVCRQLGFEVETDTNDATLPAAFPMSNVAIYAGWYAGDVCGALAAPKVEFMPGAFAYHLHSFSAATIRSSTQNWCGPLLARGATCTMGCVYEPYLHMTPNIAHFLACLGAGFTFGEAAWASQQALSWQTTVIGDPLYQPFKKTPAELHAQLARTKNPLIEWSFDRLVCLDRARGLREPQLIQYLQNVPGTTQSAVLSEKLAELCQAVGKPNSAIEYLQRALELNPSPQQRIRLRLALGKHLAALHRLAEALKNYKLFLAETPNYAGKDQIVEKIQALEKKETE